MERSLKLTRMGLSSVTGGDVPIKNGNLTWFPLHIEAIRRAGYGYKNYQKVASQVSDLRWKFEASAGNKVLFE